MPISKISDGPCPEIQGAISHLMPQAEDFARSDYGTPSGGLVGHFGVEINMSGKGSRLNDRFWVVLLNVS